MQPKILLKPFDNNPQRDKSIDLNLELLRIQQEQEIIFQKKLKDAQEAIHAKILKELEDKFKIELKNIQSEIIRKSMLDIQNLSKKFDEKYALYQKNCTDIINIFLNHHLKHLHHQIIIKDVIDNLNILFKENQKETIMVIGNENILKMIHFEVKTETILIDFIIDETVDEGDIYIKHKEGGIQFSSKNIMNYMNDVFKNFTDYSVDTNIS